MNERVGVTHAQIPSVVVEGTDLNVSTLCLGGNVFGWSANAAESEAVLDAYAAAGGNLVDTADVYPAWAPGCSGGESESIIGTWMALRGNRDEMLVATKVGRLPDRPGLSRQNIVSALDESLARLQTDYVDLFYAHLDDLETPLDETFRALDEVVRSGKVRWLGVSNWTAQRLREAAELRSRESLSPIVALSPQYNLVDRDAYEGELADVCVANDIACFPWGSLAFGFLTGKYGHADREVASVRAARIESDYANNRAVGVLDATRHVARRHGVSETAVALAWLRTRPGVVAPIASARTTEQLAEILEAGTLELDGDDVGLLDGAA